MIRIGLIFLFLLIFSLEYSCGQSYSTKNIDLDDGLLDIQCFDVIQDSDGYIWVGNRAGVNKYDGRNVTSFTRKDGLLADNVFSIHEDSQKRKWIINLNGEPLFIKANVVHNRYTDPYLAKLKSQNYKEQIFENSEGSIVFVNDIGLIQVLQGSKVSSFDISNFFTDDAKILYGFYEYKNKYYALHEKGVDVFNMDFSFYKNLHNNEQSITVHRKCIHDNAIFYSSGSKILSLDLVSKEVSKIHEIESRHLITDLRMIDDVLFISTTNGILTYDDQRIVDYLPEFKESISAVVIDEDKNMWFASRTNGLIQKTKSVIKPSRYNLMDSICYLKESNGEVHIGKYNGEFFVQENNKINPYKMDSENLSAAVVSTFEVDDELWAANSHYLFNSSGRTVNMIYTRDLLYNPDNDKFYHTSASGLRIIPKSILKMSESRNKERPPFYSSKTKLIPFYQAYKCKMDNNRNIWVGAEEGLFKVRDSSFTEIQNLEVKGSLIDIVIVDDHIFGINYGKGIFVYNIDNQNSNLFSDSEGLLSNNATKIAVDLPYIYAAHALGISKMMYANGKLNFVRNFGFEHSMISGDVDYLSVIDGVLQFGVNNKSFEIEMSDLEVDSLNAFVTFQGDDVYSAEEFKIEYDCINYAHGKDINYEYRLNPIDTSWTSTQSEKMTYRYLPIGSYTFEVRATHPLKLPSKSFITNFTIKSRWYQSKWTHLLLFTALFMLSWFLVKIDALNFSLINVKRWIIDFVGPNKTQSFNIKDINGAVHILDAAEICFVKSSGNYVEYHTADYKIVTRSTFKKSKELLKKIHNLRQVHRSYIANLDKVKSITSRSVLIDKYEVPYSSTYKENIDKFCIQKTMT